MKNAEPTLSGLTGQYIMVPIPLPLACKSVLPPSASKPEPGPSADPLLTQPRPYIALYWRRRSALDSRPPVPRAAGAFASPAPKLGGAMSFSSSLREESELRAVARRPGFERGLRTGLGLFNQKPRFSFYSWNRFRPRITPRGVRKKRGGG